MTKMKSEMAKKHGLVARSLHWGFVVVFLYALLKQLDAVEQLNDSALLRFEVLFAIGFLLLLAVRFVYMRFAMPTALPESTSPMMKLLARAGHLAMYVSLAMIALSGLAIGASFYAGGANGPGMGLALVVHETSVLAAYVSIGLHVAAAVFHRLKGDGIWNSMVPIWTEPRHRS